MADKQINPILKLVLELGPVLAYFGIYQAYKDQTVNVGGTEYSGIIVATAAFVPLMLAALAVTYALTRELPRMAVFTAIVVVVFGGLTVWLNDETFTKMRPTVVYGLFGSILGWGIFVQGRSYLKYLMGPVMPLQDEGWRLFTRNWVFFFAAMALFNEFVWRVLGEEAWVWLDTFGQLILTFLFLASQWPILQKYGIDEAED
ncbi:MAG: inner membrane-spanning protein YciB [Pseudomonadota bacterium]